MQEAGGAADIAAHDIANVQPREQLRRIVTGRLPVRPDRRDRAGVFIGQREAFGQQRCDLGRICGAADTAAYPILRILWRF